MKYSISFKNPLTHFVDIELTCDTDNKNTVNLNLPAWRPGRYESANYAQNIRGFRANDKHGAALSYKKVSRNKWQVLTRGSSTITVAYQYYAFQPDAGGSVLDDRQLYLNFINCMLYPTNQIDKPCLVHLKIDKQYKIACGLHKTKSGELMADSYYQLVDSPLFASPHLKHWKFRKNTVQFHLWFIGAHRLDKIKVIRSFKSFAAQQINTMGSFPGPDFHFLFQFPEISIYHGVEHANSTVIALGPGSELHKQRYNDLLGVSSHELFHCWNVLKIRPKKLLPYDFQKEVYFNTGFIAEGITTYYGDLFLVRSGVFDQTQYFKELNTLFKRHFENEGRHHVNLIDSSRDLWVDGYKDGAPGKKVSIYTKGALVSLILDLTIRKRTQNRGSLDQVMRHLWNDYGKKSKGYTLDDFVTVCEQVAGTSLRIYFEDFIYGTVPLEVELSKVLGFVGCSFTTVASKQLTKKLYGFRTVKREQQITIIQIAHQSPAYSKLSIGDILISVNDKKPIEKLNRLIEPNKSLRLVVSRQGRKVRVTLKLSKRQFFEQHRVVKSKKVTVEQQDGFRQWLGESL